jgi:hypothetical protein
MNVVAIGNSSVKDERRFLQQMNLAIIVLILARVASVRLTLVLTRMVGA